MTHGATKVDPVLDDLPAPSTEVSHAASSNAKLLTNLRSAPCSVYNSNNCQQHHQRVGSTQGCHSLVTLCMHNTNTSALFVIQCCGKEHWITSCLRKAVDCFYTKVL